MPPPFINIREIVKKWKITLRENVKPNDILHSIQGLSDSDIQNVDCDTRNHGHQRGMDALLDNIPRRDSHVFFNFLVALEEHQYAGTAREIIQYHKLENLEELKHARATYGRPALTERQGCRHKDNHSVSRSLPQTPPSQPQSRSGIHAHVTPPLPRKSMDKHNGNDQPPSQAKESDWDRSLSYDTPMEEIDGRLYQKWADKLGDRWRNMAMSKGWNRKRIRETDKKGNSAINYLNTLCDESDGFTVRQFYDDVRALDIDDLVVSIENALGVCQERSVQRSMATCTDTPETDGTDHECEEVMIGATFNAGNDNFNDLNEERDGAMMNIRTDDNDQINTSVEENYEMKNNDIHTTDDDHSPDGRKDNVSRRKDSSCNSNLLSHNSYGKSYDNKGYYDSNVKDGKEEGDSGNSTKKNTEELDCKSDSSKSARITYSSPNEKQTLRESKGSNDPLKLDQDKGELGNYMHMESNSKAVGELVRQTQEEEFEKLRRKHEDTEEDVLERSRVDVTHRGNSASVVMSTMSSPHGSKLNLDSMLSSKSVESIDTEPKIILESSPDSLSRQEVRQIEQPMTDPDNYKRPEPLLSTTQSVTLPSLGSNVMMYGETKVSNSDQNRNTSHDGPLQVENFNTNTRPVQPSSCSNRDTALEAKTRNGSTVLQPICSEPEETGNRIMHPSSYTGDSNHAYESKHNGWQINERNGTNVLSEIPSVPMVHTDPIIDQPESSADATRRDNPGINPDGRRQTYTASTELLPSHMMDHEKPGYPDNNPFKFGNGRKDEQNKIEWQSQRHALTHPSSTQLSMTPRDVINDHPASFSFSDDKAQDAVNEIEGQFLGLTVTHPASTQLSTTPREVTRGHEASVTSVSHGSDRLLPPFVTQPESSQQDQESNSGDRRSSDINKESSESSSNSDSLIVTHPDSFQGDSLPKGRSGGKRSSLERSEHRRIQPPPNSGDTVGQSGTITQESDNTSKQSEKNCETEAMQLRVDQTHQINMGSYRDIQRSIPGTPASHTEQMRQNPRNNELSDIATNDTHVKEPS